MLDGEAYTSTVKVLLSGLGADEQVCFYYVKLTCSWVDMEDIKESILMVDGKLLLMNYNWTLIDYPTGTLEETTELLGTMDAK